MVRFVGIDAHKRFLQIVILDAEGAVVWSGRCDTIREQIRAWAEKHLEPEDKIVLESTGISWALVDELEKYAEHVVVSNPMRTKAIASAKVKTDKIDARVLADLLRCQYLPEVWRPDKTTRKWRTLTHRRSVLVRDRTRIKNRIHGVLTQRLIHAPVKTLFSAKGLEWLRSVEMDQDGRMILDSDLLLYEVVESQIEALGRQIAEEAYELESVRLLMTLPGVDYTVALGLIAAWGSIERFPDANHAAAYLGLAPSTRQSAKTCYHGRITKQGNSQARWLLVQAAQHLDRNNGPLGAQFRKLARKKNRNIAVVAMARKLAVVAWHMLKKREPYHYATPSTVKAKMSRFRILATGERRRGGTSKGEPRPASYGTGKSTRKIPSLQEVCESEGIPTPKPLENLPPGEKKMLRSSQGVYDYANATRQSKRVPRQASAQ